MSNSLSADASSDGVARSDLIEKSVRGVAWGAAAQISLAASGYIVAIVLARTLGPVDYGTYGLIYSLLMAAELLIQMGVPVAVSRLIAENPQDAHGWTVVGLLLVIALYSTLFLVTWNSADHIAQFFNLQHAAWFIKIAALDLPFYGAYLLLENALNGQRDFRTKSIALFLYGSTKIVGIAVLVIIGPTIAGALVINVVASVIALTFAVARVGSSLFTVPQVRFLAPIAQLALPTLALDIGGQCLLNLDFWMLSVLDSSDPSTHGYYAAARNLTRLPMMISPILIGVLVPSLAHGKATGNVQDMKRVLQGAMRFLLVTLVPGCALMAFESGPLMNLMFSSSYESGGYVLALLTMGVGLCFTTFTVLLNVLLAIGKQRLAAITAMTLIVPCLIANIVLVPPFGSVGAAFACILSSAIAVVSAGSLVWRELGPFVNAALVLKTLAATVCVCIASLVFATHGMGFVIELACLGFLFLGLAMTLRLLGPGDLALLRGKG